MINPMWLDADRRVVFIPTEYVKLDDPLRFATKKDHGRIILWNEKCVTVFFDGGTKNIECRRKNLFWEDGLNDFDEKASIGAKHD